MPEREASGPDRKTGMMLCALVLVATAVAYSRTFTAPFNFDDTDQILRNPALQELNVRGLFLWGRTRFIPFLTLALNYHWGARNVIGYHAVNLAIHLLNCFLVFRLVLALCATPALRGGTFAAQRYVLAAAAAFLFGCHPIQIQAVTYIVQRVASLAATFFIGSVLAYVTARLRQESGQGGARGMFILCGVLAFAAFFSKENTVTLPLVFLAVEAAFFPAASLLRAFVRMLPALLLMAAIPVVWLLFWEAPARAPIASEPSFLLRLLQAGAPAGDVSPLGYFLTELTVIPRYLTLVFLPWGFNVDHDVPILSEVTAPVVVGALLIVSLLTAGLLSLRRLPLVGFGVLWFFLAIVVESSFLPISDAMMEHRMYLPMFGVSLLVATGVAAAHARVPALTNLVAPAVGVVLIGLTIARNEVWRTELGLWQDALAKSPGKARPHINVGVSLQRAGDPEAAIPYYCEALRIDPFSERAQSNLDIALNERLDRALEEGEIHWKKREDEFDVRIGPDGQWKVIPRNPCK